jgi:hypothetical protein
MPRMAFGEPNCTHRRAAKHTVLANGLGGVLRAAWKEATALPEHRTNAVLVGLDKPQRSGARSQTGAGLERLLTHAFTPSEMPAADFALANFAMSCSSAPVHSAITAPTSLVVIAILKRTTYCDAGSAACRRRNCSRMRRLTALRNTAVRAFFLPIMRPSRGRGCCESEPGSARR